MNRSGWRLLMTCLLLIALPLKGFAAVSMLACGPDHHRIVGVVAQVTESGSGSHDHGSGLTHHHSTSPSDVPVNARSGVAHDNASAMGQTSHANTLFKCSSCAPCCAGVALTSDAAVQVAVPVSSADFPVARPVLPSAPVGRLDRPPKTILA